MPALKNPRHERFVLALSEGKSASEAYASAGYKPCRQSASRLLTKADIEARLAELQASAAKSSEITIASILEELESARSRASSLDQLSTAVKATMGKAQISGLLVSKQEVAMKVETADRFAHCDTAEVVARTMIEDYVILQGMRMSWPPYLPSGSPRF
jgi:phage terminase small subunit